MFRRRLWQVLWSETLPASDRWFSTGAGREAFRIFAVCVVALTGRFCNGFLPGQTLKFYGAIYKDKAEQKTQSIVRNVKIVYRQSVC